MRKAEVVLYGSSTGCIPRSYFGDAYGRQVVVRTIRLFFAQGFRIHALAIAFLNRRMLAEPESHIAALPDCWLYYIVCDVIGITRDCYCSQ